MDANAAAKVAAALYGKDGESLVILLGGSSKERQREAIATARESWADYKRRK